MSLAMLLEELEPRSDYVCSVKSIKVDHKTFRKGIVGIMRKKTDHLCYVDFGTGHTIVCFPDEIRVISPLELLALQLGTIEGSE